MKRILAIMALAVGIALSGAFVYTPAQTGAARPDGQEQSGQSAQTTAPSCPMMSGGMMGGMMQNMGSMACPMMQGNSQMAGQCMQMMMGDEGHRRGVVETLRQNPELREQLKQVLQESER